MHKAWTPPARYVFGAATLLGVFSTLQAYRLATLSINEMNIEVWRLLALNLAYWYVPATLTSPIFRIAHRFPLDAPGWLRALAVHALAAVGFSIVHLGAMIGRRAILWPGKMFPAYNGSWTSAVQRTFRMNSDWALMTHSPIVGASNAPGYYPQSRARAIRAPTPK